MRRNSKFCLLLSKKESFCKTKDSISMSVTVTPLLSLKGRQRKAKSERKNGTKMRLKKLKIIKCE
jgi:hypothetical protein